MFSFCSPSLFLSFIHSSFLPSFISVLLNHSWSLSLYLFLLSKLLSSYFLFCKIRSFRIPTAAQTPLYSYQSYFFVQSSYNFLHASFLFRILLTVSHDVLNTEGISSFTDITRQMILRFWFQEVCWLNVNTWKVGNFCRLIKRRPLNLCHLLYIYRTS